MPEQTRSLTQATLPSVTQEKLPWQSMQLSPHSAPTKNRKHGGRDPQETKGKGKFTPSVKTER